MANAESSELVEAAPIAEISRSRDESFSVAKAGFTNVVHGQESAESAEHRYRPSRCAGAVMSINASQVSQM